VSEFDHSEEMKTKTKLVYSVVIAHN